jgi:hypothetical protein
MAKWEKKRANRYMEPIKCGPRSSRGSEKQISVAAFRGKADLRTAAKTRLSCLIWKHVRGKEPIPFTILVKWNVETNEIGSLFDQRCGSQSKRRVLIATTRVCYCITSLQEMCWLLTLKIRHKIVIMVDLWWFYDEKIIVKNGASLMIEHDEFTEIVITVYDDIGPS